MTCEEIRNELLSYINGFLKGRKAAAIEKHLEICRECREISQSYAHTWQVLGELAMPVAPDSLRQNVEAGIVKYLAPPTPVTKGIPRWVYVVAASLLLLLSMWVYLIDQEIPSQAARLHLQTVIPDALSGETDVKSMVKGLVKMEPDIILPTDTSLLGGRICLMSEMLVAHVTYQYQGILISLFIWDNRWKKAHDGIPKNIGRPVAFRKHGLSVVIWERSTLMYCLVADLEPAELAAIFGLPSDTQYNP